MSISISKECPNYAQSLSYEKFFDAKECSDYHFLKDFYMVESLEVAHAPTVQRCILKINFVDNHLYDTLYAAAEDKEMMFSDHLVSVLHHKLPTFTSENFACISPDRIAKNAHKLTNSPYVHITDILQGPEAVVLSINTYDYGIIVNHDDKKICNHLDGYRHIEVYPHQGRKSVVDYEMAMGELKKTVQKLKNFRSKTAHPWGFKKRSKKILLVLEDGEWKLVNAGHRLIKELRGTKHLETVYEYQNSGRYKAPNYEIGQLLPGDGVREVLQVIAKNDLCCLVKHARFTLSEKDIRTFGIIKKAYQKTEYALYTLHLFDTVERKTITLLYEKEYLNFINTPNNPFNFDELIDLESVELGYLDGQITVSHPTQVQISNVQKIGGVHIIHLKHTLLNTSCYVFASLHDYELYVLSQQDKRVKQCLMHAELVDKLAAK